MTNKQKFLEQASIAIIEPMIQNVNNNILRKVLQYRYLENMEWAEIAEVMNYSERHIYRLHEKALKKLKC